MAVYNWSSIDIEKMTNFYLYGRFTKPDLLSDKLIRQQVVQNKDGVSMFEDGSPPPTIELDEVSFMASGPGRYVKPSMSVLVKGFFNDGLLSKFKSTGALQEITLAEVIGRLGYIVDRPKYYNITLHQYEYDVGSADFLQRSYIYDKGGFSITDKYLPAGKQLKFVIQPDGTKYIENMQILALDDDFDLSTTGFSQVANAWLQPYIDPSKIGRKIVLKFDAASKAQVPVIAKYTIDNFKNDEKQEAGLLDTAAGIKKLNNSKESVVDQLWGQGVTKFLDSLERPIIYGSNDNNTIDAVNLKWDSLYPKLSPYKDNGVVLFGGKGYDSLTGTNYKDKLYGGDENDGLKGGRGEDELTGGKGNDNLTGGDENDKFIINNGDGWDTIYDREHGDRIIFNGTEIKGTATYIEKGKYSLLGYSLLQSGFNLVITAGDGVTAITVKEFFTTSNGVYFDTSNIGITIPGTYQQSGEVKTHYGTENDDFLDIVGGPNVIYGLGGNDRIYVHSYSSTIDGGAGNDYISGSGYTDTLSGGLGDDIIVTGGGLDIVHGGEGNDRIISGGGAQKIFGDGGLDIVDYSSSVSGVEVNLALTTAQEGGTYSYAYGDILSGIEDVIATGKNDSITGNSGNNNFSGGAGADKLDGAAGVDTVSYAGSNAAVNVNLGITTAQSGGDAAGDTLFNIENIIGSSYNDTLLGNAIANIINGGLGNDRMTGGAGADVFKYSAITDSGAVAGARDIITDFVKGTDKIDLGDFAGTFTFKGTGAFTSAAHEVNYAQVSGNTIIGIDADGNGTLDMQIELTGLHTLAASDFLL